MLSWIAGLGLKALAGKMLGSAASGIRGVGRWLAGLNFWQLACIALALFGAWQTVGRWSQHRHTVKVEGQLTETNKLLQSSLANETTLKVALAKETTAIGNLVTASHNLQASAAKGKAIAAPRAANAQAVSDRFKQSSRVAPAAPCEPSDALKGQWQ